MSNNYGSYLLSARAYIQGWRLGWQEMILEDQMFNYIKKRYLPDLERSKEFDTWDCISQQSRMYIELKARRNHYTELLIEKSKYESLTITAVRKNYTAWYINATPLGLWAFNLTKLSKPVWRDRPMPSSTEFADKSQRIKQVGYLKLVDGIQM
jgi:hypothetical protein